MFLISIVVFETYIVLSKTDTFIFETYTSILETNKVIFGKKQMYLKQMLIVQKMEGGKETFRQGRGKLQKEKRTQI